MVPVTPKKKTLDKYGLTAQEWSEIAARQNNVCGCCKKLPKSGRLHTDHYHIRNWKLLPATERKLYVRGLLCFICNSRFLGKGMTVDIARGAVEYLQRYDTVKPS